MDTKLSNRLFKKYKFLRKKELAGGFECGDGWYQIIDDMCKELRASSMLRDDFVITKVFDKYGDMYVHSRNGNNATRSIIEDAIELSMEICDACGQNKDLESCPKCTIPVVNYDDDDTDEESEEDNGSV